MSDPRPRLGERYELLGRLSSGPSGAVWCGRDLLSGSGCAVRILEPGLAADPTAAGDLLAVLGRVGRLAHPGIVAVDDVASGEGCSALVMPLISGENLQARLGRLGALEPAEAASLIAQLCDALAAAHATGLAHGRIKPSNILLEPCADAEFAVKLSDFGMAVLEGRGVQDAPRDAAAAVEAAHYRAPELKFAMPATAAADVYAVGVVLYEALVGRPPFTGTRALDIAGLHREAAPQRVPDVPDAFWPLLTSSLAKQPDQRPTCADLAGLLRGIAQTASAAIEPIRPRKEAVVYLPPSGVSQRPAEPVVVSAPNAPSRRPPSRFPRSELAVCAGLAVVIGGIAYFVSGTAITLPGAGSIAFPAPGTTTQSASQSPSTAVGGSSAASPSSQHPASQTSLPSAVLTDTPLSTPPSPLLTTTLPVTDPIKYLENMRAMIQALAAQGQSVIDPNAAGDLENLVLDLENSVVAYQQNGGQAHVQEIRNKISAFDVRLSLLVSQGRIAQGAANQLAVYLQQLSPA